MAVSVASDVSITDSIRLCRIRKIEPRKTDISRGGKKRIILCPMIPMTKLAYKAAGEEIKGALANASVYASIFDRIVGW